MQSICSHAPTCSSSISGLVKSNLPYLLRSVDGYSPVSASCLKHPYSTIFNGGSGCIILSYVLLGFRWWRAIRAMKSGVVAASYLDPLAVRVQSVRMGASGRGWRRFLVFAELTKGRKGAEYVALFTYFSFEGKRARIPSLRMMLIGHSVVAHMLRRRSSTNNQCSYSILCA